MLDDVRFAFRTVLKDRGFTITAVLTLAVCIAPIPPPSQS